MGLLIFTHRKKLEHHCPHLSSEMRCNKSPQLKIYTILIALMSFVWQRVKAWSERQKNVLSSNYSPWKESIRIGFFSFFWIFFFLSIYSPTRVSTMLRQKSLFARTNNIPKRMLRVTIVDWTSHKTAILKIGRFILSRWSSLVFSLHISFLIFAFLCTSAELHLLTIELFIIYNS